MPRDNTTNPWGDAANQAVGALYKYYMSQPNAADMVKSRLQQAQLEEMQRGQSMGEFTMQNLSPEIRNDLYRRSLESKGDTPGARLFGAYVNKPMQLDVGDAKYVVDGSTGLPMQEYGVGVAPDSIVDKEGGRIITTPAVPATNRPSMPISDLFGAVIQQESGGNPNALSPVGAAGIAQIMPDTARQPGYGVTPLQGWDGKDPRTAPVEEQLRFGQDYLDAMITNRGGNVQEGLAAYNAGPGAVQKYGGIPPYDETQQYVENISRNAGIIPGSTVPQGGAQQTVRQADGTTITQLPMSPVDQQKKDERGRLREIQTDLVNDDIQRALSAVDSSMPVTGLVGSMTAGIPQTPAHNLSETLKTIKANIGFDRLQAMREASPTGGALGQVAVQELEYLQSVYGSLAQSQSEEQFRYNLMRLYNTYNDIVHGADTGERYDIPTMQKVMNMQTPEEIQAAMEFFNYNPPAEIENAIIQRANQLGL